MGKHFFVSWIVMASAFSSQTAAADTHVLPASVSLGASPDREPRPSRIGVQLLASLGSLALSTGVGFAAYELSEDQSCSFSPPCPGSRSLALGLAAAGSVYALTTPLLVYLASEGVGGNGSLLASYLGAGLTAAAGAGVVMAGVASPSGLLLIVGATLIGLGPVVGAIVGYELSDSGPAARARQSQRQSWTLVPNISPTQAGAQLHLSL